MAINAIGQLLGAGGVGNIAAPAKTASPSGDFGKTVVDALDSLQKTQNSADNLAVKAATGDLNDVHNYMIAATEASVQTELTVAIRNKAVESFNEIMRMQV
ncbi:MAG: flagellar hook-basal body complex protein FliE [Actinomycetota bacterium]|nr:flagellar hook-basal body complex protein FliE [Actinomycetota bacterium]